MSPSGVVVIVSPNSCDKILDEETFNLLKGRKVVILLDDLGILPSDYNLKRFTELIGKATKGCYGVAGTCQDGADINAIVKGPSNHITRFCERLPKFRLTLMNTDKRVELAETTGMPLNREEAHRNYPLPGNITMRDLINKMAEVFHKLEGEYKDVLRAMKLLYTGGVRITTPRVRAVLLEAFGCGMDQYSFEKALNVLRDTHFLLKEPSTGWDSYHFGYLEKAVSYEEGAKPKEERWDHLTQALEKTKDAEALLYLGYNQGRLGDLKRALKTVDAVLRLDDENAQGHFQRGYTLARLGRLDEALIANKRAVDIRPDDFAEAYNNRGYIFSGLGKWTDAVNAFTKALEIRPEYDDAHTNRGVAFARMGRKEDALKEFGAALGIRKSHYAYLCLGITLSRYGDLDGALEVYKEALRIKPDYPEAYFNRGITLAKKGIPFLGEALTAHEKAINLRDGNYPEAHMHRGKTLFHLERPEDAIKAHSRAIELQDDYALAYMNRGLTYSHMGKEHVEQAKKDWQAALARGALALGSVPLHSMINIAKSQGVNGALTDALAMFDEIVAFAPGSAEAHLERGITLAHMDRLPEALCEFDRALELGLDTVELHSHRGLTLAFLKKYAEAFIAQTRVIELEPGNALAYANRGRTSVGMEHLAQLSHFAAPKKYFSALAAAPGGISASRGL